MCMCVCVRFILPCLSLPTAHSVGWAYCAFCVCIQMCMIAHVYDCICVCMIAYVHVCMYACMHVCMCIYIHMCERFIWLHVSFCMACGVSYTFEIR